MIVNPNAVMTITITIQCMNRLLTNIVSIGTPPDIVIIIDCTGDVEAVAFRDIQQLPGPSCHLCVLGCVGVCGVGVGEWVGACVCIHVCLCVYACMCVRCISMGECVCV